jgi:hypothetical protein
MPILGIIASSTLVAAGDFESIATVTVGGGGAADVEFTSIPGTFTHLQVRGITLGSAAASGSMLYQFNSDTSSNYNSHLLGGNGSVATSHFSGGGSETSGRFYGYYDNLANNNYPLVFVMDILDYANTNKYKTVKTLSGMDKNGNNYGEIFLYSSLWRSTTAVSTLKLFCGGQNLGQYTQFALYGIRSA